MKFGRWLHKLAVFIGCGWMACVPVYGFDIRELEFEGISAANSTVTAQYRKQWIGKEFTAENGQIIIDAVYRTGEVERVHLLRSGDTLIVRCIPRARIAAIDLSIKDRSGNKNSRFDQQLKEALEKKGIVVGGKLEVAVFRRCFSELETEFEVMGIHDVAFKYQVLPIFQKAAVRLRITAIIGDLAPLKQVKVLGARQLSEQQLLSAVGLDIGNYHRDYWLDKFWTRPFHIHNFDGFRSEMQNVYRKHGYRNAELFSPKIELSADKNSIFVTYVVSNEGEQYYLKEFQIICAEKIGDKIVENLSNYKKLEGKPFNPEEIQAMITRLKLAFSKVGYWHSDVQAHETWDDKAHTVAVKIYCRLGTKSYIRNVLIEDGASVREKSYLRFLKKHGGSVADGDGLDKDLRRLQMLGCFERVERHLSPVPDRQDLWDVRYTTTENAAGLKVDCSVSCNAGHLNINGGVASENVLYSGRKGAFSLKCCIEPNEVYTDYGLAKLFGKLGKYTSPRINLSLSGSDEITFAQQNLILQGGLEWTQFQASNPVVCAQMANQVKKGWDYATEFRSSGMQRLSVGPGWKLSPNNAIGIDLGYAKSQLHCARNIINYQAGTPTGFWAELNKFAVVPPMTSNSQLAFALAASKIAPSEQMDPQIVSYIASTASLDAYWSYVSADTPRFTNQGSWIEARVRGVCTPDVLSSSLAISQDGSHQPLKGLAGIFVTGSYSGYFPLSKGSKLRVDLLGCGKFSPYRDFPWCDPSAEIPEWSMVEQTGCRIQSIGPQAFYLHETISQRAGLIKEYELCNTFRRPQSEQASNPKNLGRNSAGSDGYYGGAIAFLVPPWIFSEIAWLKNNCRFWVLGNILTMTQSAATKLCVKNLKHAKDRRILSDPDRLLDSAELNRILVGVGGRIIFKLFIPVVGEMIVDVACVRPMSDFLQSINPFLKNSGYKMANAEDLGEIGFSVSLKTGTPGAICG